MKTGFIVIAVIVFVLLILYFSGSTMGNQCTEIGECKSCWNTYSKEIESSLCGNQTTCTPEPYKVQHNAIVDVLVCACDNAKTADFTDAELNARISEVYKEMTCAPASIDKSAGTMAGATSICRNGVLTKWEYS